MDDLKAAGLLDRRPAVAVTADLFDEDADPDAGDEQEEMADESEDDTQAA